MRRDYVMKLSFALSLIIGAVVTGCGGRTAATDPAMPGRVFSAPAFMGEFEKRTGHKLFDLASPAIPGVPRVHRLDVLDVHAPNDSANSVNAEELVRRYGHFSIFLYTSASAAREAVRGAAPDDDGIYWTQSIAERGPHAGESHWIAEKLYPENIVSSWGARRKRLDGRWTRLDELLNKIAGGATP